MADEYGEVIGWAVAVETAPDEVSLGNLYTNHAKAIADLRRFSGRGVICWLTEVTRVRSRADA